MAAGTRTVPTLIDRRARVAVAALFLTNGALFAGLVPHFPQIKTDLGLSNAGYGLAIAAFPTGAIVAGLGAGVVIRQFGSARVAVAGTWLTAVGILTAGLTPAAAAFAAALFLTGALDAITDVAQNTHGLRVQRRYGRSVINSFHAIWSIGAVTGGALAAGALALGLPRSVHLGLTAALFATVSAVALHFCLPGPDPAPPARAATDRRTGCGRHTVLVLAALVLIAIAGALVEDAGATWAAVYLSSSLDAAAALAAWGYIALVGAQFIGRLAGDRLVDRFGQRAVARAGGAVVAAGMGVALAWPTLPGTIAGFAATGFGVATLVPAAMHTADELPGLRPGTGLTVVSWLMRLGFLLSPPLLGAVADATCLRVGLLIVPISGITVVFLATALSRRTANH